MRNGVFSERDRAHIAFGAVGALANAVGYFLGLPITNADVALLVSHHDKGGKTEPTATGDNLGTTVDVHDLFKQAITFFFCRSIVETIPTRASPSTALLAGPGGLGTINFADDGALALFDIGLGSHDIRVGFLRKGRNRNRGIRFGRLIACFVAHVKASP